MFKAFRNIPIFRRLVIVFAVATLIPTLAILMLGSFALQSSEIRSDAVRTSFDAQNLATQEQINLQRMNALVQARFAQVFAQGSHAQGDPSSSKLTEDDVNTLEAGFEKSLDTYQTKYEILTSSNMSSIHSILLNDSPVYGLQVMKAQKQALDTVAQASWPNYKALLHTVLDDLAKDDTFYLDAYGHFYQADLGFLELKNLWQTVVNASTNMGTTVTQVGASLATPLILYTGTALTLTLLVIIGATFLVNRTIVNPLRQLVTLTKRVAQGDTQARAAIRGRDEIDQVAISMNGMLDNMLLLMQEAQTRHADLQAQIQRMSDEVSGVGEGNLRVRVHMASSELGLLAGSFNAMAGELSKLVVNVKLLTQRVQNSTLQVFGHMEHLVDNADEQIQNITHAAGDMGNVVVSSRQVAERAQKLSLVANNARQAAQKGRDAITQTSKSMTNILENVGTTSSKVKLLRERSQEISSVVKVITSIAQQTNRLALDASVQAAAAGDHGKGFGVIATDIRQLAERAKAQSLLVAQIAHRVLDDINGATVAIQKTRDETATGVEIVQDVSKALDTMFSAVEHQASEIEVTNQVATQQVHSSNKAVQMMQQALGSTQQSSAITRTVAHQMEDLARLAGQLQASVEIFKLQDNHSAHVEVTEMSSNNVRNRQLALGESSTYAKSSALLTKAAQSRRALFSGNMEENNALPRRPGQQMFPEQFSSGSLNNWRPVSQPLQGQQQARHTAKNDERSGG